MAEYIVNVGNADAEHVKLLGEQATRCFGHPVGEQIVRCRDCKHFTPNKEHWLEPPKVPFPIIGATCDTCDFWADGVKVEPDGYCAWGERKDG